MKKIFTIALLRDLEKQVMKGDISYSKMVEILNEKANEFAKETLIEYEDFATQNPMLGGSVNEFWESNYKSIQMKERIIEKTSEVVINYHGEKETFKAQVVYKPNPKQIGYILDSHKKLYNPFNYEIKSVMIDGYLIDRKFYELK